MNGYAVHVQPGLVEVQFDLQHSAYQQVRSTTSYLVKTLTLLYLDICTFNKSNNIDFNAENIGDILASVTSYRKFCVIPKYKMNEVISFEQ